jgi:CelD/BcsL family acetyltransferase involved in cellulose biosynthesis
MHSRSSASAPLTTRVIQDFSQLDALEKEWSALFEISPAAAPPLHWGWVREWWRIYGDDYEEGGTGLRIVTFWRQSQLAGVLPLYEGRAGNGLVSVRKLRFISTGLRQFEETTTEYLNLLYAPNEAEPCMEALRSALNDRSVFRWDEMDLENMPEDSPLLALAETSGWGAFRSAADAVGDCYVSDLSGGFDSFLERLSGSIRRKARKLLRDVEAAPDSDFSLAAAPDEINEYFDQMVYLHKQRWQEAGVEGSFAPRHAEFHRSVAHRLVPEGRVVLARLKVEGEPVAVLHGYLTRHLYHCYQRGVVRKIPALHSPGTAAILLLMKHLADGGATEYDHLMGVNNFKEEHSQILRPMMRLKAIRSSWRPMLYEASLYAQRAVRYSRRRLANAQPGKSGEIQAGESDEANSLSPSPSVKP